MRTARLLAIAVSAVLAPALTACGSSPPPGSAASASSTAISFNDSSCGGAWHLAHPGWHTFEITSEADYGAEVDLTDPASGAVYDELENIGPGTTAPMSLDVGSGRYAFLCAV
jgi:iron uptake system component EfeO